MHGWIKVYCLCYKSFVNWFTNDLFFSVKPSKKHKQGSLLLESVHPLAVLIHRHQVWIVSDDTNFCQQSLRRVKIHSNLD